MTLLTKIELIDNIRDNTDVNRLLNILNIVPSNLNQSIGEIDFSKDYNIRLVNAGLNNLTLQQLQQLKLELI